MIKKIIAPLANSVTSQSPHSLHEGPPKKVIRKNPALIYDISKPRASLQKSFLCALGDVIIAELLIENGADVNVKNDQGETPIFDAIKKGD